MTWPNTSQQDFEDLVFAHVTQLNGLEWTSKFFSLRIRTQLEDGGTKFGKFKIDQMQMPVQLRNNCPGQFSKHLTLIAWGTINPIKTSNNE